MGQAYNVVRQCINYRYPLTVGKRLLDPNKIVQITRQHLIGTHAKETLHNPSGHTIVGISSLYYLVESFNCGIKPNASLTMVMPEECQKDIAIQISTGLLRIKKRIPLENYPPILDLFYRIMNHEKTYTTDESEEVTDPQFEFLNFLEPADLKKDLLDASLVDQIFQFYQKNLDQQVQFRPKYLEDYLNSTSICKIQYGKGNNFNNLESKPMTIDDILRLFMMNHEKALTSSETLLKALRETKLRFSDDTGPVVLVDCLEGELLNKRDSYFKVRGMWYKLRADFHTLVEQDFKEMLKRTLIDPNHEAKLPKLWAGNVREDAKFTETVAKENLKKSKGIRKFMKSLKEAEVYYVDKGAIKQKKMKGEILKNPIIHKHQKTIEEKILSQQKMPPKEEFVGLFGEEADVIMKELCKKRSVFFINKSNELFVVNPFIYPLKDKDITEDFVKLLEKHCLAYTQGESEEDFCRTHDFYFLNHGKPFGPEEGWIVLDQICPNNIEPCDILHYTKDTTYLYHVKEKFGQHTRDVCSQILNAAQQFRSALSIHQPLGYLKQLWLEVTESESDDKKKKVQDFLKRVKQQLIHLGKEDFFRIFRERKLVFVYALLKSRNKNWQEEANTPVYLTSTHLRSLQLDHKALFSQLKAQSYLDTMGRLTSTFYGITKKKFSISGFEKSSDSIYDHLCKFKSKSQSTLAKIELIKLSQEMSALGFEFRICEIERKIGFESQDSQVQDKEIEDFVPFDYESAEEESSLQSQQIQEIENGPFGISNIGNSCYISSALQLMFSVEEICRSIQSQKNVSPLLKKLYDLYQTPDTVAAQKKAVKSFRREIFDLKDGCFSGFNGRQQDAHELLQFLLGKLDWNPMKMCELIVPKNDTQSGEEGIEEEEIEEGRVRETPTESTNHLSISLDPDLSTFQDLINKYFEEEEIIADGIKVNPLEDGTEEWSTTPVIKQLPTYFIIQLNRFDNLLQKIAQEIDFSDGCVHIPFNNDAVEYEIIGYIHHLGKTMRDGHYTADIKIFSEEDHNGQWINCNDSTVKSIDLPKSPGKDAYIILLKQKNDLDDSEEVIVSPEKRLKPNVKAGKKEV